MIFVTTGQRIAVENFSKGVIYKVIFSDESISYMMCVGTGKDFVMLQGAAPSLFALTMQSASRVSTIDIHDPTPPEPPTPLENVLQYQTGEPPFTFTTTENALFSWYIEGAAGVKTANLLSTSFTNGFYLSSSTGLPATYTGFCATLTSIDVANADDVTFSYTTNREVKWMYSLFSGDSLVRRVSGKENGDSIDVSDGDNIYLCFYVSGSTVRTSEVTELMLNEGDTALPYEPYGKYKLSIYNNEHTTTIYLDEPIAEGEKLYSVNIDAQIITDIGENTLSVSDPQPPEMQIVYGIYAEG